MSMAILGIGTALPAAVIDKADALALARSLCNGSEQQETWLEAIYEHSGITTRRFCLSPQVVRDVIDGTDMSSSAYLPTGLAGERGPTTAQRIEHYADLAPPLAITAARQAIECSGISASAVTHIVTVSCTGFLAPGIDHTLIEELGLSPDVERTHVGYMGCHGALNGLRVARAYVDSDPRARVLVAAVELCCLHYFYGWDPQKVIANSLFADGAAALILGRADDADKQSWRMTASGSHAFPDSQSAMTWTIGDHGFEMTLSKQVPAIIGKDLRLWLEHWLGSHGLSCAAIPSWAVHPGGPKILDGVAAALALTDEHLAPSRAILAEYGNMSSPTILFILDRLRRHDAPRPCVALAFGPGLAVEAALFE
jgi:predicted naringenin-chalcone synthase